MMEQYFLPYHLEILSRAVEVSEDIVSDSFGLTTDYWKKNPFEVKTLLQEKIKKIPENAYAHLSKYENTPFLKAFGSDIKSIYKIVIFDPRVLKATMGIRHIIEPFLIYVIAHELIHILRFSRFECCVNLDEKTREEEIVHNLTNSTLKKVKIPYLTEVIEYFEGKIEKLHPSLN